VVLTCGLPVEGDAYVYVSDYRVSDYIVSDYRLSDCSVLCVLDMYVCVGVYVCVSMLVCEGCMYVLCISVLCTYRSRSQRLVGQHCVCS
jgi:hypothetical protein